MLCSAKLYMISCLQGSMTLFRSDIDAFETSMTVSYLFGVLLIGNILDNIPNPKILALTLQLLVAFSWILTGIHVNYAL